MPRKLLALGIADDMLLDQALIEYHLKAIKNTKILFRCGNGSELLFKLQHFKPEILIMDMYMPIMNGWETLHELRARNYDGKIICTTTGFESNLIARLKDLGVQGFARKQTDHITKAVLEVSEGRTYYDEEFISTYGAIHPIKPTEIKISGRDIEIINKLAQGKSSKQIALEIGTLTADTIDTYIKLILDTLELENRAHLVAYAFAFGLIYDFNGYDNMPKPKVVLGSESSKVA